MIKLRIECDEFPWFGEEQVREFERANNLPEFVSDTYMNFYKEMIETKLEDPNYFESHPVDHFRSLESTVEKFAEIISGMGADYVRPQITDRKTFIKIFGIDSALLRKKAANNCWRLTVKKIVTLAEQLALNGHIDKK